MHLKKLIWISYQMCGHVSDSLKINEKQRNSGLNSDAKQNMWVWMSAWVKQKIHKKSMYYVLD